MSNPAGSVVVTGMGLVTPIGSDVSQTWTALIAGRSGIGNIAAFDASGLGVRIAGEVRDDEPYDSVLLGRKTRSRREAFALRAVDEALRSAELTSTSLSETPLGLFSGCERENINDFGVFASYKREGQRAPVTAHRHRGQLFARQPDSVARQIFAELPSARLCCNYTMACAAGAVAAYQALRWLRSGVIQRAVVFAADTPINVGAVHGFEELGALSTLNDEPARACRPFDQHRDGFVLAEGAAAVVFEHEASAVRRGHRGLGRLVGAGMTNNQASITTTPASGEHAARAIRIALADAGIEPSDVGYINGHGTSTDTGDAGEAAAILSVFEPPPPTSSTKSMTGHMVAASGVTELIITLLAVREGVLPPTINHSAPDPEWALDCVPNTARPAEVRHALSNSFGFGGTNVSLIVSGA